MKSYLPLTFLITILTLNACTPFKKSSPIPLNTAASTVLPVEVEDPLPEPTANITNKKVNLVDTYELTIPDEFTVHELLSSPITAVPIYTFEVENGPGFLIAVHPYVISPSLIPGQCVVSTGFDSGEVSDPVFCEGQEITSYDRLLSGWTVKYGSTINDLSLLLCTANSPCPVDVPPEERFSISYVFIIPDKSNDTILEFFVGNAFRTSSNEVDGFKGVGLIIYDLIIPSLKVKNP